MRPSDSLRFSVEHKSIQPWWNELHEEGEKGRKSRKTATKTGSYWEVTSIPFLEEVHQISYLSDIDGLMILQIVIIFVHLFVRLQQVIL